MRRKAALTVATWARERVPLYRDLYAGLPSVSDWPAFRRLPLLTGARLRATPLAEQVDALEDVLRTLTPYRLGSVVVPAAMLLDRDDTDAAYEQTRDAFARVGVRKGTRLAIITPPEQRYLAAELGEQLGYYRVEAHVVVCREADAAPRALTALAADRLLTLHPTGHDAPSRITVRNPVGAGADLYVVPEAGVVATRGDGEEGYRVLTRYWLLEAERDGRLLLTALRRFHQPLIRYELPDRGRIERGRLWLDEVAV